MVEKIKGWLDSSWTWLVAVLAAMLYFWKRERDLENELEEQKVDATLKSDTTKISDADAAAQSQLDHYESLLRQYNAERTDVPPSTQSSGPSDSSPAGADSNKK